MPISELVLYFLVITLSYFRSFIWSLVIKGSGSNSKIEADTFAKDKGKGINPELNWLLYD